MKGTVKIGNSFFLTNQNKHLSRHQVYRGMAALSDKLSAYAAENVKPWAVITLRDLRNALDAISLEDVPEAFVRLREYTGVGFWLLDSHPETAMENGYGQKTQGKAALRFQLGNGGSKVRVTAPCGETRVYRLATLDQALSKLGA